MKLYQIKNWDEHYENAKSRTISHKSWGNFPNKQDGLGYSRLLLKEDGESLYGAFVAVVLCASKQARPREGYLTDTGRIDGVPYDATALALKTRFSVKTIEKMLSVCSSPEIDWIKEIDVEDTARIPQGYREDTSLSPKREGGKEGMEGRERKRERSRPSLEEVKAFCSMNGIPYSECEAIWNHFEASGWIDKNGHPVMNWQAKFKSLWLSKQNEKAEKAQPKEPKPKINYNFD